jgi:O-antigen biosynthesis protein
MTTLRSIYDEHSGKVSDKWRLYLEAYNEAFAPLRQKPIRMFEIGIQNGGSLEIWPRFFEQGTFFVGCDIDPSCAQLSYADPRVRLVIGDANDPVVAQRVLAIAPEYDLVIEDGSHTSIDIVRSFATYFPHVAEDGLFVVEDMHCSYWMQFGGGLHHPYSSVGFFKHLVDVINHEHWGVPAARLELLAGFRSVYGLQLTEELLEQVHSVTFLNSLCFVRKRRADLNVLGSRIVTGGSSVVVPAADLSASRMAPKQTQNPFASDITPPEEAVGPLRERVSDLVSQLEASRASLAQIQSEYEALANHARELDARLDAEAGRAARLEAERTAIEASLLQSNALAEARARAIAEIHNSRSWKLMAPGRAVGGGVRALSSAVRRIGAATMRISTHIAQDRGRGVPLASLVLRGTSTLLHRGPRGLAGALREYARRPAEGVATPLTDDWVRYNKWIANGERPSVHGTPFQGMVSVVVPVCNTPARFLEELFDSLCAQTYSSWELCIHDDASDLQATIDTLSDLERRGRTVRISRGERRSGIAGATNAALQLATGRWVAFVDHDDLLAPDALRACVQHAIDNLVSVVYTDHDVLDEAGRLRSPYFKPDFNRDLLLAQMYIGHLVVAERDLVERVGGLRPEMDGAQDYDLMLRMVSAGARIGHVAAVLYHWRQHEGSTAANPDSKPYANTAGRRAIQAFLDVGAPGAVVEDGVHTFCYDVRYMIPGGGPTLASIIIPIRDRVDLLEVCIRTLLEKTVRVPFEIIIVDNGSRERETVDWLAGQQAAGTLRVIRADVPFNWSRLNNLAAVEAKGDVLVFLNNDTEFVDGDWLQRLCENALRKEVGCCGPLLTYPDGTIQHAGVVVGMGGWADHVYKGHPVMHSQTYFASPVLRRDVLALTGACLAISRTKFDLLGGFDESFVICGSDVELCLRAHRAGLLNVYVPEARVIHHESKTRDPRAIPEQDFVRSAKAYEPYRSQGDPFYNPNLDRMSPTPALGEPQ